MKKPLVTQLHSLPPTRQGALAVLTVRAKNLVDLQDIDAFGREARGCVRMRPGLHLVLDFHRVDHISATALLELRKIDQMLLANGGKLQICGLNSQARDLFMLVWPESASRFKTSVRQAVKEHAVCQD